MNTNLSAELLDLITFDTQAIETSTSVPSNSNITNLATLLVQELKSVNVLDAQIYSSATNYTVIGTLAANNYTLTIPSIGFVAHMDTYKGLPGTTDPLVIHGLQSLYQDYQIDLRSKAYSESEINNWMADGVLVANDVGTCLGINNKAGIVEILGMLLYFKNNPQYPHGKIYIAFTSDAEIERSTDGILSYVDQNGDPIFKPDCAYCIEGSGQNIMSHSNYNISDMLVTIKGEGISGQSPEEANLNATRYAAQFISRLNNDDPTYTTNIGSGLTFIKKVSGTYLNMEIELQIRDMTSQGVNDRITYVVDILNSLDISSDYKSYRIINVLNNERTNIPTWVYDLAKSANYEVYARGVINTPIDGCYEPIKLTSLCIPSIVLSSGGYNFRTNHECIPLPALNICRDVLINIVKKAFTDYGV